MHDDRWSGRYCLLPLRQPEPGMGSDLESKSRNRLRPRRIASLSVILSERSESKSLPRAKPRGPLYTHSLPPAGSSTARPILGARDDKSVACPCSPSGGLFHHRNALSVATYS